MKKLLLLAGLAATGALGTACSTLSTLDGAKTLAPGQFQVSGGLSLQRGGNPYSYNPFGIPIPQLEVYGRYGVVKDVDIGVRVYALGAGFDVRYRFWHNKKLHVATTPGIAGAWVPLITGTNAGLGSLDIRAPITAEYDVTPWFNVSGGSRAILRDSWLSLDLASLGGKGLVSRLDAYLGVGSRIEFHNRTFGIGLGGDVYLQPARYAGIAYSVGADVTFRTKPPRSKQARRPVRRR